jgi:AcrR family transcriptional regulator
MVLLVRTGWRGTPPENADEARERIVDAAMRCIDRYGPAKTGLSDVAMELGVTRQTVYRYFATTDELLAAVAEAGADSFVDRLTVHLSQSGVTTPAELVVEAIAYVLERLPADRYLGLVMTGDRSLLFVRGVLSPEAFGFGRTMLRSFPIDWAALGYDESVLDGVLEFAFRILQSLALDPPETARTGADLRAFLTAWVAPSITAAVSSHSPKSPQSQLSSHRQISPQNLSR